MIQSVEIRNFQSLAHIALEPGKLTCIVGPSSVGKSAFTRALRTLTSNRRGNEFIRHGERVASISATTEKGTVTLTRGKGTADNSYIVIPAEHPEEQRTYTKLSGETPEEVSQFLGIAAKDPINYAGQFDKPYLLDDTAGEVARTLGALTNVNIIFEGARESNRQKLATSTTLKGKAEDLQAVKEKIPAYKAIKAQDAALTRAEALIATAQGIQKRIAQLTEAIDTAEIAEAAIERWAPLANKPVPSDEKLLAAHQRLIAYTAALREQKATRDAVTSITAAYEGAEAAQRTVEAQYAELIGSISDDLAGWFAAVTDPDKRAVIDGDPYVRLDEAIRIFTLYIEEKAKAGS